jgi:hypothetical protein
MKIVSIVRSHPIKVFIDAGIAYRLGKYIMLSAHNVILKMLKNLINIAMIVI